jgi:hypothetical protein
VASEGSPRRRREVRSSRRRSGGAVHVDVGVGAPRLGRDSRMSPDLSRGTGRLIGGDLNVDDEGFEQCRFEPVQSLHHDSVGYQLMRT